MDAVAGLRVLVVDDDHRVRSQVTWQLEADGFVVFDAGDGLTAMTRIEDDRPDLVVLDLSLPGMSGLDVLRRVRSGDGTTASLPIIVLSGRSGETDRIVGLDLGADDYVVKPFSPGELAARVRSVLRRSGNGTASVSPTAGLWIDEPSREAMLDGQPIELTAKEFDLLAFLARRPRQVFTRTQLLARVWGSGKGWQGEATVTEHVRRLRQKIGTYDDGSPIVQTVRGVGYRIGQADERR
jgi:DNA-binding response OmpR family regulator